MSEALEREFIRHELSEWAEVVEERLNAALSKHQVGITEELRKSITHKIIAAAATHQGSYQQIFSEAGRFVDMGAGRKPKGLQSESAKSLSIAKASGRKPKKWYSKTFYGSINNLINRLVNNYSAFVIQNLKQLEHER